MKRAMLVCAVIATLALAGPVGSYLGVELDRTTVIEHVGRDSLHFIIGGDSILDHDYVDTTRVMAETLYAGDPAWITRRVTIRPGQPPAIGYDTLVESGDTLMRSKLNLLVTSLWADVYRVPFDSGTTWTMGLAGTYIGEFTGDTIIDTISVWGDTARVVGFEDVTVPYGTVENCARIERRLRQRFATTIDSLRLLESAYVRVTEWYKDSLCLVKDTTVITGRVFTWFIIWIPLADLVSYDVGQLADVHTGIVDRPALAPASRITASPNPCRSRTTIRASGPLPLSPYLSSLRLYDSSGRLALARTLDPLTTGPLDLDLSPLRSGTYFLVVSGQRPLTLVKTE